MKRIILDGVNVDRIPEFYQSYKVLKDVESNSNCPVKRYFESRLCHENLRLPTSNIHSCLNFLERYVIDLTNKLEAEYSYIKHIVSYIMNDNYLLVADFLQNENKDISINNITNEFLSILQSLDEVFIESNMSSNCLEIKLMVKIIISANIISRIKKFPLTEYYNEPGLFSENIRGRLPNRRYKERRSMHLGIISSVSPYDELYVPTSSIRSDRHKSTNTTEPNVKSKFYNQLEQQGIQPYINSPSGVTLTFLGLLQQALVSSISTYNYLQYQDLLKFYSCVFLLYTGGHSLYEIFTVINDPHIIEAMKKNIVHLDNFKISDVFLSNEEALNRSILLSQNFCERLISYRKVTEDILAYGSQNNLLNKHLFEKKKWLEVSISDEEWLYVFDYAMQSNKIEISKNTRFRTVKDGRLWYTTHNFIFLEGLKLLALSESSSIGVGGFGVVKLAVDQDNNLYAVKFLKRNCIDKNINAEISFLKEKSYFVGIFVSRSLDYRSVLVIQYRGVNLYKYIADHNFNDKVIINCLLKAALELEAIHQSNKVHGDIKILNFVINENEDVSLIDFGAIVKNNSFSEFRGTEGYIAPEIVKQIDSNIRLRDFNQLISNGLLYPKYGKKLDSILYTKSADVYAFGITIQSILKYIKTSKYQNFLLNLSYKMTIEQPCLRCHVEIFILALDYLQSGHEKTNSELNNYLGNIGSLIYVSNIIDNASEILRDSSLPLRKRKDQAYLLLVRHKTKFTYIQKRYVLQELDSSIKSDCSRLREICRTTNKLTSKIKTYQKTRTWKQLIYEYGSELGVFHEYSTNTQELLSYRPNSKEQI